MTKILVNASVLQQIFMNSPDVEIDLTKTAASQVAEAFKKKVDTATMVNNMVSNLEEQLHYRHHPLSKTINDHIEKQVSEAVRKVLIETSGKMIEDAVKKAMDNHKIWIQNNLNGIIIDRVTSAMRAATEVAVKGAIR